MQVSLQVLHAGLLLMHCALVADVCLHGGAYPFWQPGCSQLSYAYHAGCAPRSCQTA